MGKYIISKILSNNVILVKGEQNSFVFVGKGLGFGRKKGDLLENLSEIEEKFISFKDLQDRKYEAFFETVDPRIIELCKKINEMISSELGLNFSSSINLGLIDHVNFAIKRIREGIEIVNPFLYETKLLYPVEYGLAQRVSLILEEELAVTIPKEEIGFLALHFYGGRGSNNKLKAQEHSRLMNMLIDYIEKKLAIKLEKDSFDYKRLLIHLGGIIKRAENKQEIIDTINTSLKAELAYEYKLAFDISKIIENTMKITIPKAEIGYTAIHLHKLRNIIS
ncbi:PRD domain-containing protein [Alkaliphilus transvaalensis]|uniref:PRD domain-containing protein n=1 Tax=Alkaliphilus transvaalensis TaxID=114628 RepID=UPI0004797F77|nr:PRD domain-containing protein [Alkaliphilus transvaalensis]